MNKLSILALFPSLAFAAVKVAVIDTGIAPNTNASICAEGSIDLTNTGIADTHGHGTNISSIIQTYSRGVDYCQIIIKYYTPEASANADITRTMRAFRHAIDANVNVINYSAGGNEAYEPEQSLIKEAVDKGIVVVVAAGNSNHNLDSNCDYFPACYGGIIVVGNKEVSIRHSLSNYGTIVSYYANGTNVVGAGLNGNNSIMTGTSQATAKVTGAYIYALANRLTIRQVIDKFTIDFGSDDSITDCSWPNACNIYNKE